MSEKIRPTASWMRVWYDKMNKEVFGGALGDCELGVFTTGKGSNGRTLGWFKMQSKVRCDKYNRRMFIEDYWGNRIYISESNFVTSCRPLIQLNGNYTATEESLLNTLVHEMCHYYTYMNGVAPKQGHGPEFRNACRLVESASKGRFQITRLASAEEMTNWELDADIQAKNDARKERKKNRTMVYLIITPKDSKPRFGMTTLQNTIDEIIFYEHPNCDFMGICKDIELVEFLNANGYRKVFRSYRYWNTKDAILDEFLKHKWNYMCGNYSTPQEALGMETNKKEDTEKLSVDDYHLGFKIVKDGDGYNLETKDKKKTFNNPVKEIYFDENKNLFIFSMGKFKYEGTPGHWQKINESRKNIDTIISEAINRMINEIVSDNSQEDNDSIEITPDMNLGLASPFEYNNKF